MSQSLMRNTWDNARNIYGRPWQCKVITTLTFPGHSSGLISLLTQPLNRMIPLSVGVSTSFNLICPSPRLYSCTWGLYMGGRDLGINPLFSVVTWTCWIFHTKKVTLFFSLKKDTWHWHFVHLGDCNSNALTDNSYNPANKTTCNLFTGDSLY